MSEIMRPLSFAALMEQALGEYQKQASVFGVRQEKFYRNQSGTRMLRYGTKIDSPLGPAAGPNSQLAQNIVAAFLAGSRFIELKTVQIMDGKELRDCVARPCINAMDECYNVEWSTELTVQQAFEEYVKAWVAVYVLGLEFGLGANLVFNMSVGYSLDGIKSGKIDAYLEGMKDASATEVWAECLNWLAENGHRFKVFTASDMAALSSKVSNSVTLSTLHGCPSQEIEKIAHYLLTEKKLHTSIKCNPTLLGYQEARRIMDDMGYDYVSFDDHHFTEDLQFAEAVSMIGRLQQTADDLALDFGVKITNTFPVDIKRGELPGEEMYMSGRSLFPLSITVANNLSNAFDGQLQISYSGGADFFNLETILTTGIRPVTVATTLLKPGGYERLTQLANSAEQVLKADQTSLDVLALQELAGGVAGLKRHQKNYRETGSRKSDQPLERFDCAQAPCSETGCPINQQIPAYLEQVCQGDLQAAFNIIANDNVLPSVTGTICDHQCQSRCTRLDYDDSLQIRAAKKAASVAAQAQHVAAISAPQLRSSAQVLIIGAGPAGLAAATYLARNGVQVTVREIRSKALGIVQYVIPDFRISAAELDLDIKLAEAYGVNFEFDAPADYDLEQLSQQYDYIVIATGAWQAGRSSLAVDGVKVLDALDFLAKSKQSQLKLDIGRRVAVIGGGDVAMDCARAAARNVGVEDAVIVYRRTKAFMPAQSEEVELALADGVQFVELHAPQSFANGRLTCETMVLGDFDTSGRRSVQASGELAELDFDTVINAVGAGVDTSLFTQNGIDLDAKGYAVLSDTNQCSIAGVYIAGDCKSGPKTVVKAMADAKLIAQDILAKLGVEADFKVFEPQACRDDIIAKKGVLAATQLGQADAAADVAGGAADVANTTDIAADSARCLTCNSVCEICVDVCPNRANIAIKTSNITDGFTQPYQIIHLDGLCNECGNCGVFCPTAGNPYLDKLTLYSSPADFSDSSNKGFLVLENGSYRVRLKSGDVIDIPADAASLDSSINADLDPDYQALIKTVVEQYPYLVRFDVKEQI